MEDVDIVVNLRHLNSGHKSMYDLFWLECSKFIQESISQAVDECHHQQVTHFVTAMSVPDLISQVAKKCPEGTPIPSEFWVQLQFCPKTVIYAPPVTTQESLMSSLWFKLDNWENHMKTPTMQQQFSITSEWWLWDWGTIVYLPVWIINIEFLWVSLDIQLLQWKGERESMWHITRTSL